MPFQRRQSRDLCPNRSRCESNQLNWSMLICPGFPAPLTAWGYWKVAEKSILAMAWVNLSVPKKDLMMFCSQASTLPVYLLRQSVHQFFTQLWIIYVSMALCIRALWSSNDHWSHWEHVPRAADGIANVFIPFLWMGIWWRVFFLFAWNLKCCQSLTCVIEFYTFMSSAWTVLGGSNLCEWSSIRMFMELWSLHVCPVLERTWASGYKVVFEITSIDP